VKKETIITAVVFLIVGFLAGYITHAQLTWDGRTRTTLSGGQGLQAETADRAGAASATSVAQPPGLPEGHPPLNIAAQMRALEDQANQNPADPKPRLELANLLYDNRRYERAIEWYRRGLELDPKNINAHTDLGTAYFYTGRTKEALAEYRKSLEIDPNHEPTLMNSIVVNLQGAQNVAAAQAAWDRLHQLNPNHPELDALKQRLDAARASSGSTPARP
jgi:tetratricopeptide (TPR) repeat protein